MASNRTLEVLAVNGIKTDLWLTADKEVLPLTGQKPELYWEVLRKQKDFKKGRCDTRSPADDWVSRVNT